MEQSGEAGTSGALIMTNRAYEKSHPLWGRRMEQVRWLDRLLQQCHSVSGLLDSVFC